MINPLPTKVIFEGGEYLHTMFPNIEVTDDADIEVLIHPTTSTKRCSVGNLIGLESKLEWLDYYNLLDEIWVSTFEDKIELLNTDVRVPIIVMGNDLNTLPFSIKDRLIYLQDKSNKEALYEQSNGEDIA